MSRTFSVAAIVLAMQLTTVDAEDAQDQQHYRMRVPGVVAINATNSLAHKIHDLTDANQIIDWQPWQVVCNSPAGAIATFETTQAFTHTTKPTVKRNAWLFLSRATGSFFFPNDAWQVTLAADETNYAAGDGVALVRAEVSAVKTANLHLRVVFLEENFADTIAGDYELTVIGTITPK
ncbi:hypothetical protein Poly24_22130 [Rosistilla carotiformis]|uniref:Uncharacterized protein n=1 Tax=Rosistilla carotiformis TaxID=2528017 RepID=A0A518JSH9_9BACT|nr:hypothetical protein [Rosistilla carotiformis]QDV68504.1 hypothetical protein Poly24_22130 [Rosistilla carotiformis]